MDELILQLRSTQGAAGRSTQENSRQGDAVPWKPESQAGSKRSADAAEPRKKPSVGSGEERAAQEGTDGHIPCVDPDGPLGSSAAGPSPTSQDPYEITTSQSENPRGASFRLDFDLLASHKTPDSVSAAEIRLMPGYKVERPFYALLKSVEIFGGGVALWELCDETGVIFGSADARDGAVHVGDIVCLSNCSLWKAGGNHLNIVSANIKKAMRHE